MSLYSNDYHPFIVTGFPHIGGVPETAAELTHYMPDVPLENSVGYQIVKAFLVGTDLGNGMVRMQFQRQEWSEDIPSS